MSRLGFLVFKFTNLRHLTKSPIWFILYRFPRDYKRPRWSSSKSSPFRGSTRAAYGDVPDDASVSLEPGLRRREGEHYLLVLHLINVSTHFIRLLLELKEFGAPASADRRASTPLRILWWTLRYSGLLLLTFIAKQAILSFHQRA